MEQIQSEMEKLLENRKTLDFSRVLLPAAGLEPARGCPQQILSLPRLPFRHAGLPNCHSTAEYYNNIFGR